MGCKIEGLDRLMNRLEELKKSAEKLDGEHQLSLNELFPDFFMLRYTDFSTIDEMFKKSGFAIETQNDFDNLSQDEWGEFISGHTQFENWQEMKQTATKEWTQKKLGFEPGGEE
jgi:hypothetical protein